MADVQQWQPAPGPTLAVAASITDLRVGTWVYTSPLRTPNSNRYEPPTTSGPCAETWSRSPKPAATTVGGECRAAVGRRQACGPAVFQGGVRSRGAGRADIAQVVDSI